MAKGINYIQDIKKCDFIISFAMWLMIMTNILGKFSYKFIIASTLLNIASLIMLAIQASKVLLLHEYQLKQLDFYKNEIIKSLKENSLNSLPPMIDSIIRPKIQCTVITDYTVSFVVFYMALVLNILRSILFEFSTITAGLILLSLTAMLFIYTYIVGTKATRLREEIHFKLVCILTDYTK